MILTILKTLTASSRRLVTSIIMSELRTFSWDFSSRWFSPQDPLNMSTIETEVRDAHSLFVHAVSLTHIVIFSTLPDCYSCGSERIDGQERDHACCYEPALCR